MGFLAGFDHKTYWGLPVTQRIIYVDILSRLHNGPDRYNHHGVPLNSGQCLVTRKTLANSTGLRPKTVSSHLAKMPMFHTEIVRADVAGHRAMRITYLMLSETAGNTKKTTKSVAGQYVIGTEKTRTGNTETTGNTKRYTEGNTKGGFGQNTEETTEPVATHTVTVETETRTGNTDQSTVETTAGNTRRNTQYLQGLCYNIYNTTSTCFKNKNVEIGDFIKSLKRCYERAQDPIILQKFGSPDGVSADTFGVAFEWWVGTIDWDSVDNPIAYMIAVWDQRKTDVGDWDHPIGQYNRQKSAKIQQVIDDKSKTGLTPEQERQNYFDLISKLGGGENKTGSDKLF